MTPLVPDDIEFELLLEAIWQKHGYDFRQYARSSLRRRMEAFLQKYNLASFSHLQYRILRDPSFFGRSLDEITVRTTEMFRDSFFFTALRNEVLPILQTYPALNIWHAGCSTGEEVYSVAILLMEAGLYERSTIYATDINPVVLEAAQEGRYPVAKIKEMTKAYQQSGGVLPFSNYYTCKDDVAKLNPEIKKNVVFSTHNLATDESFIDAQLVICRNVLIYFDRNLQDRAVALMTRSLSHRGFLCLGSKESASFLKAKVNLEVFAKDAKIYRKL
ncbi:MAG: protein-glutamate O-methyltransferase CheR [Chitinophagaceae bacterium]|nr:protein-glutamate O-methyltransferase CheR [Oligoflexus sp.]